MPDRAALPPNLSVLVVFGDRVARSVFQGMLESAGVARVLAAESPDDALERIADGRVAVDAVFSDLHFTAQMDAIALMVDIRRTRPTVPFLIVTDDARAETVARAQAVGVAAYLVRPVSVPQLAERLRAALAMVRSGPLDEWRDSQEGRAFARDAPAEMYALYEAWAAACGANALPKSAMLNAEAFLADGALQRRIAVVRFEPSARDWRYVRVGGDLKARLGRDPTGETLGQQPMLFRMLAQPAYTAIYRNRCPHYSRVRRVENFSLLAYARLLLPFADSEHPEARVETVLSCFWLL